MWAGCGSRFRRVQWVGGVGPQGCYKALTSSLQRDGRAQEGLGGGQAQISYIIKSSGWHVGALLGPDCRRCIQAVETAGLWMDWMWRERELGQLPRLPPADLWTCWARYC